MTPGLLETPQYTGNTNRLQAAGSARTAMHVCGLNHVRAQVGLRERYALSPEASRELLKRIRDERIASQALVLSTCNRTEIYAWDERPGLAERLHGLFLSLGGDQAEFDGPPPLYQYQETEAIRHLFAVAAGLDSMLLGENQIKQQLRLAYEMSQETGCSGSELHQTVQAAILAGKRIRTQTALNDGTLCVARAAVLHGEARLGGLKGKVCMILGAGKIGRIAALTLAEYAPSRLIIVNRSIENARELASRINAEAYGMESLDALLPEVDFLIGAAYAPEQILTTGRYAAARGERTHRACLVDVAVPRIFDPAIAALPEVELHNIEALEGIVEQNRLRRQQAAGEAWKIVEEEVEKFRSARLMQSLGPRIQRLTRQFDAIFEEEQGALQGIGDATGERLPAVLRRIKQRLLHQAILGLKEELASC